MKYAIITFLMISLGVYSTASFVVMVYGITSKDFSMFWMWSFFLSALGVLGLILLGVYMANKERGKGIFD